MDIDFDQQMATDLSSINSEQLTTQIANRVSGMIGTHAPEAEMSLDDRAEQRNAFYEHAGIPRKFWSMNMSMWRIKQNARGNVDLNTMQMNQKKFAGSVVTKYIELLPLFVCGGMANYRHKGERQKSQFNSLVLYGGGHSGKSFLAALVAMASVDLGIETRYFDYEDIKVDSKDDQRFQEIYGHCRESGLIIVDSIFPSKDSYGWQDANMRAFARSRLSRGLPFIATVSTRKIEDRLPEEHPFYDMVNHDGAMHITLPTVGNTN